MAIEIKGHRISTVVVSSVMGHSGGGLFPYTLFPGYRQVMQAIKETGTTVFTKSSTALKNTGNFIQWNPLTWKYVQKIDEDGLLNAYGQTNDGVLVNAEKIALAIKDGYQVIPNFFPQFSQGIDQVIDDISFAVDTYRHFLGKNFWALEFDFSCHNADKEVAENMANALACVKAIHLAHPDLCLIGKVSHVHPNEFSQELVRAGVDIIHAINSIPYDRVYDDGRRSPLARVGGGCVSGGPAWSKAFLYNYLLRKALPSSVPMIMGCGVARLYDALRYLDLNNNNGAVSICTVIRHDPKEAVKIIKRLNTSND